VKLVGQGSNACPFFSGSDPMPPPISKKLVLEWVIFHDGRPALAFDKPTWLVYEETAATGGQTAQEREAEHLPSG
jgi:hypothetical protein